MEEQKEIYLVEYEKFVKEYKLGFTSGEQVGALIVRMVQYYCDQNNKIVVKDALLNTVSAVNVNKVDDSTGKSITVSKADLLTRATPEYTMLAKAKANLQNIEQCVNALKSLQKGVLNEYNHIGNL